ncbi:MAG: hypothetical protein U1A78_32770 [Polyangia bacterium]
MSEDDIIYWQDVLESVLAKRTSNLTCPFCYQPGIEITKTGKVTRVACTNKACRHYIEGSFGDHADQEGEG